MVRPRSQDAETIKNSETPIQKPDWRVFGAVDVDDYSLGQMGLALTAGSSNAVLTVVRDRQRRHAAQRWKAGTCGTPSGFQTLVPNACSPNIPAFHNEVWAVA
jgi:hypothetical protein